MNSVEPEPLSLHQAAHELGVTPEEMFDLMFGRQIATVVDDSGLLAVTRQAIDDYRRQSAH